MSDNDDFEDDKAAILGRKIEELEALLEQTKAATGTSNIPVLDDLVEYQEESVLPTSVVDRFTPKINLPDPQLEMPSFQDKLPETPEPEVQPQPEPEPESPMESFAPEPPAPVYTPPITEANPKDPVAAPQTTSAVDVDSVLQQIEAKITHDLDTLVEILKDTIKDSVMTEIKTHLQNNQDDSSKSEQ